MKFVDQLFASIVLMRYIFLTEWNEELFKFVKIYGSNPPFVYHLTLQLKTQTIFETEEDFS